MPAFEYGNARLRAMKSRLLPPAAFERLTGAGSVAGLIQALLETAYRPALEAAMVRLTGIECVAEALRADLVGTLGKARDFFTAEAGELAAVALRRYDLHNVVTVLRGLSHNVPPGEILAGTLPVGDLRPADLAELVRSPDPRAAIDLLATWAVPLARPLLAQRDLRRDASLEPFPLELALQRWHYRSALQTARDGGEGGAALVEMLLFEADTVNILTALRLVGLPDAAATLREVFGGEDLALLFVGPGRVPPALLAQAARRETVTAAIETLAPTPYGPILAAAMPAYAVASALSAFERALRRAELRRAAGLIARDPLGIGVLLGYQALKTNEIANLRAVAQGLQMREPAERIRAELLLPAGGVEA